MNLFRVPMIDHRQQFGGEMIALMNGKPVYFSDARSTEKSAGQKSDQLPAKLFPMIDHRKQFEIHLSDHRKQFGVPMIDHRKRFDGQMIALLTGTFFH